MKYIITLVLLTSSLVSAQRSAQKNILPPSGLSAQVDIAIIIQNDKPVEYTMLGIKYKKLNDVSSFLTSYIEFSPETTLVIKTKSHTPIGEIKKVVDFIKNFKANKAVILIENKSGSGTQISINPRDPLFRVAAQPTLP